MTSATDLHHPAPPARNRRRFWSLIAFAVVAFALIAWSIAWVLLSIHLRSAIDGWMDFRRAVGDRLTHGERVLDGYPFEIRFTYADVDWQRVDGPRTLSLSTDSLEVAARPWEPFTLRLVSAGPLKTAWRAPSLTVAVTAASGTGALVLAPDHLDRMEVDLRDPVAVDRRQQVIANAARLKVEADPSPQDTDDGGVATTLRFAVTADALEPAGFLVQHLPFEGPADGRIRAAVRGPLPISLDPAALALWRDAGGVIDVDHLGLNWRPLDLEAEGTVTLDALMRPQGAAMAEIRGMPAMIDRAEGRGLLASDVASVMRLAAAMFSRTGSDGGSPSVRAPVTIQDGRLAVGPVKILRVPSLIR